MDYKTVSGGFPSIKNIYTTVLLYVLKAELSLFTMIQIKSSYE